MKKKSVVIIERVELQRERLRLQKEYEDLDEKMKKIEQTGIERITNKYLLLNKKMARNVGMTDIIDNLLLEERVDPT